MDHKMKKKIALRLKKYPTVFDLFKSFSRIFDKSEIYLLLKDYCQTKNRISFIQVGAHDGISNDPLREFIVRYKKWHGYLLEPLPKYHSMLQNNYQNISANRLNILRCAIAEQKNSMYLYQIKEKFIDHFPQYAKQIASINRSHLINHFPFLKNEPEKIEKLKIPVITMRDFIDKYNVIPLDVLCLDAEGLEAEILNSFPFKTVKPDILIYETLHLQTREKNSLYDNLRKQGYDNYHFEFDSISSLKGVCRKWKDKYSSHLI